MIKRIICIGNQYITEDAAGHQVYLKLKQCNLPPDVELINGGIAGLNLLYLMEGVERVVFVDAVSGFGQPGEVVLLEPNQVFLNEKGYDHAAGLAYLLQVFPQVCEGTLPEQFIVGIEGPADEPAITKAVKLSLVLAQAGITDISERQS